MEGFLALIKEQREENDKLESQLREKEKIIEDIKNMFNDENLNKYYHGMSYEFEINDFRDDILSILERK